VLDALTRADPRHRPASAHEALLLLVRAVDLDTAWDSSTAPEVRDVLGRPVTGGLRERLATACLVGSGLASTASLGADLAAVWP
jgi:hypothetical protein